jgi:hypothetical protein
MVNRNVGRFQGTLSRLGLLIAPHVQNTIEGGLLGNLSFGAKPISETTLPNGLRPLGRQFRPGRPSLGIPNPIFLLHHSEFSDFFLISDRFHHLVLFCHLTQKFHYQSPTFPIIFDSNS